MSLISPGGPRPPATPPAVAERLRGWIRDALGLDGEVTVLVTQLACTEPGCPPVETVLAALPQAGRRSVTLPGPAADLTEVEVRRAFHLSGDLHAH
ncbi:hypothetical protein [Protofrankia symbiont of Coriaria ruscifolia]|uniref:Uncharacterized protein n=1 Tax=Candidatus Protofrankia californiensis TaxID=1839754 RepID=A0A1C3NYE6_9ACTN|nr:hypothetical protein [Protofrankia symbiont of Coriaria ruscifolia]SBW22555.1 hypothetical protein FDG2_2807 [Candidatus Protofrankia californiensis]